MRSGGVYCNGDTEKRGKKKKATQIEPKWLYFREID